MRRRVREYRKFHWPYEFRSTPEVNSFAESRSPLAEVLKMS